MFAEPGESRAFGMAVALYEANVFTWPEFQAALVARIARWQAAPTEGRSLELLPALAGCVGGCAVRLRRRSGRRCHCASPVAGPETHSRRPPALTGNQRPLQGRNWAAHGDGPITQTSTQ
jgi:hypothetical protein